ncbi:hypothetical protein XENTR_v10003178 [Xenopus tropicalis]|nr:hypothetical protein XENTR_v10003178 [Xenopus tropicalis]
MAPNEFLVTLDIKDAYLHVPIFPPHWKFLRFAFKNRHFQFTSLPFGLTSAPRIFTKIMAAALRSQGVSITPYLDDLLLKAPTLPAATAQLSRVLETLTKLGWKINTTKSRLIPAQRMPFLGMIFDTSLQKIFLPQEKITRLQDTASPPHQFSSHPTRNASPRVNGLDHRGRTIRSVPPACCTVEHSGPVEADKSLTMDTHLSQDQNRNVMVVRQQSPFQGSLTHRAALASSDDGRQPQRVGRSSTPTNNSRNMVDVRVPASHKYFGDQSGAPSLTTLASTSPGPSCQDPVRQRRHRCLPQPPRGHKEPASIEGGQHDPILGRVTGRKAFSSIHTRPRKLASRLPQQTKARSRGMGPKSQGVSGYHRQVGSPGSGPYGLSNESPSTPLHGQMPRSHGNRGRCSDRRLELLSSLRLPSTSTHPKSTPKDQEGGLPSNSDSTILAQKDMVHRPDVPQQRTALSSPLASRPAHAGSDPTSESSIPEFNGLALESLVPSRRGFSTEVIQTMMAARRPVSAKAYHRVWRIYQEWCQSQGQPFQDFSIPRLLSFLQSGLDKGLSLGSLKSQISALSVLFQQRIALLPDVRTFLQGVSHLHPPFRDPIPPWDLNLVLTALQAAPFEPLATIPLAWVSWKTAFLLAIASARRVSELSSLSCQSPYLIFHEDRTVLRTIPSFTPKVISAFHINQDITIPSFCPNPKTPKEVALHSLDPVRALKFYLHRTKDIRTTNSLFVLHSGPQKGSPASKTTVSRWIKEAIRRAYITRGKSPPLRIRAHSTMGISTSWAFRNKASAEQVCRAATWSSLHSFTKFYRFEVFAASDAHFGRKVLQVAVS